jgi:hypothetical protein
MERQADHFWLFFFEMGAKALPNLFIKKRRIAQLINRKLGENRYNTTPQTTPKGPTNKHTQHTTTTNRRSEEHHTTKNTN